MGVWHVPLSGSLQERNKKKADRMMADYDDDEDDYRYYKWVHGMIVECMSYVHGAQYMSYAHGAQYMSYAHGAQYMSYAHGAQYMSYAHGAQYMSYVHGVQYVSYAHGAQYFKPHKFPTSNTMCANPLFN